MKPVVDVIGFIDIFTVVIVPVNSLVPGTTFGNWW